MEANRMLDRHYDNFNIAGFTYYDGADVFNKLKIGSGLCFAAEPDNKFDESAVAIYYNKYKLGYIPQKQEWTCSRTRLILSQVFPKTPISDKIRVFVVFMWLLFKK
jgi:hypothetical protein